MGSFQCTFATYSTHQKLFWLSEKSDKQNVYIFAWQVHILDMKFILKKIQKYPQCVLVLIKQHNFPFQAIAGLDWAPRVPRIFAPCFTSQAENNALGFLNNMNETFCSENILYCSCQKNLDKCLQISGQNLPNI